MKGRSFWAASLAALVLIAGIAWWALGRPPAEQRASDGLPTLTVTVYSAPSRSSWFPVLIRELGLDTKNGFHLVYKQKPGDVAYAEFASGVDKLCYCVSTAAGARFLEQGADITLLWSVNDAQAVLVTNNPAIRTPKDLNGRRLAGDTGTGNYAIAAMLLARNGVDLDSVKVQSVRGSAVVAQLAMHRVDAIFANPEHALKLQEADPENVRVFNLIDKSGWRELGYGRGIPHMNFGVWRDWIARPENLDLARRFYRANVQAAAFAKAHPEDALKRIERAIPVDRASVIQAFRDQPDTIHIAPMGDYREPVRKLTTSLLPSAGLLDRPFTEAQLDRLISDFRP